MFLKFVNYNFTEIFMVLNVKLKTVPKSKSVSMYMSNYHPSKSFFSKSTCISEYIYHLPYSNQNKCTDAMFLDDWAEFLESLLTRMYQQHHLW